MRNGKPIIIALSSNDGLGLNLKNIGALITNQNIYFVPFGQDDKLKKPYSLVADLSRVPDTLSMALEHDQIQPIIIEYRP
jgi:dipicolinate synthase subunit B